MTTASFHAKSTVNSVVSAQTSANASGILKHRRHQSKTQVPPPWPTQPLQHSLETEEGDKTETLLHVVSNRETESRKHHSKKVDPPY
jgi:hypothetical protein